MRAVGAWVVALGLGLGVIACESAGPIEVAAATAEAPPATTPSETPTVTDAREAVAEPAAACELVDPPAGMIDLGVALPSAIVIAGYHRPDNFTGAPLPGYEARGAWFEREAADALLRAADALAEHGLRLLIHDAYRPRSASLAMLEWAKTHDRLDLIRDGWVAPHSLHNRGRAIDLGLADVDGVALDMGGGWDQFDARSELRGVEGAPLERRLRLRRAMVAAGFTPYAREWWHFSYTTETVPPAHDQPYRCRARTP